MRPFVLLPLAGLLWGLTATAAPPQKLVEARALIDDLEFEAALKALDAVEKYEGNDRSTLLEVFSLQGIAYGTLGKEARTRDAFRRLLVLEPGATIPADLPPRVRTPFFEAKDWSSSNGPLLAQPRAQLDAGRVKSVSVVIEKDVLRLARVVRFHLSAREVVEVPLKDGSAQLPVGRPSLSWWAEVLNERKGVLLELGSAEHPHEAGEVATAAAEIVETPSAGWRRPTGIAVLGAGAVAAGVGLIFGIQAHDARTKVAAATRDELGRVASLTQRDAVALETSARTQAATANVLFGVGGALAAAGVVLIILGPSGEPALALSPVPGGAVVVGSF